IRGRLIDRLDHVSVDGELDARRCPVGRVRVQLARVDRKRDSREVIQEAGVAEWMDADADDRLVAAHVAAEDLAHADLARVLGLVLVADHPERDHRVRIAARTRAELDRAVLRCVEARGRLRLGEDRGRVEAMLPDRRTDQAREGAGLEGGDPRLPVELGAPRRLVGLDPEAQSRMVEAVARSRLLAAAPVWEGVGHPPTRGERVTLEGVLEPQPRERYGHSRAVRITSSASASSAPTPLAASATDSDTSSTSCRYAGRSSGALADSAATAPWSASTVPLSISAGDAVRPNGRSRPLATS